VLRSFIWLPWGGVGRYTHFWTRLIYYETWNKTMWALRWLCRGGSHWDPMWVYGDPKGGLEFSLYGVYGVRMWIYRDPMWVYEDPMGMWGSYMGILCGYSIWWSLAHQAEFLIQWEMYRTTSTRTTSTRTLLLLDFAFVCLCVCLRCIYIYIDMYICIYIYIYSNIYTHTYASM
jgi:hypothetical protein